jgi:hypothetical protein
MEGINMHVFNRPMIAVLSLIFAVGLHGGCTAAGKAHIKTRLISFDRSRQGVVEKPLSRSLFKKPDDIETISEEVIQRVVNAPLIPEFPARAGVVVLDAPYSRKTYATLTPGDRAPQRLARSLERSRHFVMVSDISPYLVKGQHIEALRALATRYRLKYLVVFNRSFADQTHVNHWAWSWLSVLGIPFAPAYTLQTAGLMEATLMDVRTGTFLFTTQVHLEARQRSTPWSSDEKLEALQLAAARRASQRLAQKFLEKCRNLVRQVKARHQARLVLPKWTG